MTSFASRVQYDQIGTDRWSLISTSCILAARYFSPLLFSKWFETPLVLFLILVLGSPHGAVDHLIYFGLVSSSHEKTPSSRFSAILYYGNYLGLMTLWGVAWYVLPSATLFAFLLISAFHFGETDMDALIKCIQHDKYSSFLFNTLVSHALLLSRGSLLVGLVMTSTPSTSYSILSHMTTFSFEAYQLFCHYGYYFFIFQHYFVLAACFYLCISCAPSSASFDLTHMQIKKGLLYECTKSAIFLVLFSVFGSCTGFSIFFGCWHSLTSISQDIELLRSTFTPKSCTNTQDKKQQHAIQSMYDFYIHSIPYTIVALLMLGGMALWYVPTQMIFPSSRENSALSNETVSSLWAVFIVFISIVTGPHMWVMSLLHQHDETIVLAANKGFCEKDAWKSMDPFGFRYLAKTFELD